MGRIGKGGRRTDVFRSLFRCLYGSWRPSVVR